MNKRAFPYYNLSTMHCLPTLSAILLYIASPGDIGLWWTAPFALVPFFYFLLHSDTKSKGHFFIAGLGFGTLLYILLMYWIGNVLAHFGGLPLPIAYAALFLLALYMGLYPAFFSLITHSISETSPLVLLFLLPTLWVAFDWIRSFLFTGLPWLDIGYFYAFQPSLIQFSEIFGHYGLTWLTIFTNTAIALIFFKKLSSKKERITLSITSGIVIFTTLLYSIVTFSSWEKNDAHNKEVTIAIIQGNIAQDEKWSKAIQKKTLQHYLQQTLNTKENKPILAVWPETAMPFFANINPLVGDIINFTKEHNIAILSGAPYYHKNTDYNPAETKSNNSQYLFYNSALLFSSQEEMIQKYYKSHLVPFGEYVPLQKFLFFLAPLVESAGNFSAGRIEKPIELSFKEKKIKMGVLICYESIFSAISRKWSNNGANILVNLTNDAWYGRTNAPHHSLAMTVLRAVENRRDVVRSANTGFSALISSSGKISKCGSLFEERAFTVDAKLIEKRSFYSRVGWLFAPICGIVLLCTTLYVWRYKICYHVL